MAKINRPPGISQAEHALIDHTGIPGVGAGGGGQTGNWVLNNTTVDLSSWRNIQIQASPALITKVKIIATDGNATPNLNYDIEIYEQSAMTSYAYVARGISEVTYIDAIPWEWFGEGDMYIHIINNQSTAITDLDITIYYRS